MTQRLPNYEEVITSIDVQTQKLWALLDDINANTKFRTVVTAKEIMIDYTNIYNLCQLKEKDNGLSLYTKFQSINSDYLRKKVFPVLQGKGQLQLLQDFNVRWELYKLHKKFLIRIFAYVNRSYIELNGLDDLDSTAVSQFQSIIIERFHLQLFEGFSYEFQRDRREEESERNTLRTACEGIVNLYGPYEKKFMSCMIQDATSFYNEKYSQWSSQLNCVDYLKQVKLFIEQENVRITWCLHSCPQLINSLVQHMNTIFIENYKTILHSSNQGIDFILKNDQFENFALVYQLYSRLQDNFDLIKSRFKEHVVQSGKEIVNQKILTGLSIELQNDPQFVGQLFEFHDKYMDIIYKHCGNNNIFKYVVGEAFEIFLNFPIGDYGVAEFLAIYGDKLLSKDQKISDDTELQNKLDKLVTLFSYLSDKDLFITIYQNQLSKRLLLDKSQNLEDEKHVMNKIKQTCGNVTTKQLEDMIIDFQDQSKIQQKFLSTHPPSIINNIRILSLSDWPKYKEFNQINIHPDIPQLQQQFVHFYKTSHPGYEFRQLKWANSLSSVTLIVRNANQDKFECTLSVYQAQILYLFFTEDGYIAYSTMKQQLNFDDQNLVKNLSALCHFKLLEKETTEQKITPNERFRFNQGCYNEKRRKIVLPFIFAEEQFKREQMNQEREISVEASIVKIMKARKQLPYPQLITETQNLLKIFKPTLACIKQRIEKLISMEYLARESSNFNIINYVS